MVMVVEDLEKLLFGVFDDFDLNFPKAKLL